MERIRSKRGLARAIKQVVEEEDHWNQGLWISARYFQNAGYVASGTDLRKMFTRNVCGTTACVAGTAIILTLPKGGKYNYSRDDVITPDGLSVSPSAYAKAALGLTDDEAEWLFSADRTKRQVMLALDLLIAGKRLDTLVYAW